MGPLITGLLVVAIGMAWGADAGYAINPARDFGPRLASYLTGYRHAWRDQYGDLYFWVPIVGPLLGGPLGAAIYQFVIARFLPSAEADPAGSHRRRDVTAGAASGAWCRPWRGTAMADQGPDGEPAVEKPTC